MVESERNFYLAAQQKGTRAAFLDFFADDAIIFRPGPVNGKEVWRNRKMDIDLLWGSTMAAVSRSGDLGYDAGPSKWRLDKTKEEWTYANYISIWKKAKDGSWKVAVDCATENPRPDKEPGPLSLRQPSVNSNNAKPKPFSEAQREFVTAAKGDFARAVGQFSADEVRLYRDGAFPAAGKESVVQVASTKSGGLTLETMKTEVSSSVDLAYYYGKYFTDAAGKPSQGHFLQIWQTNSAGAWELVLDWQQPLPGSH